MKTLTVGLILLAIWVPSPARASRSELASRGLPSPLALDSSLLRLFPASAGRLTSRLEVDLQSYDSNYYIDTEGQLVIVDSNSGNFLLALAGRKLRYGYVIDGSRHHILLASPSGWGLLLGYEDRSSKSERHEVSTESDTLVRVSSTENRSSERRFRLALGWHAVTDGGRVFEIGVGGGSLRQETLSDERWADENGESVDRFGWKSDRGYALDAAIRTVTPGRGPLIAVQAAYENPDPGNTQAEIWRLSVGLHVGWRLSFPHLDDLVVGGTSTWNRSFGDRPGTVDTVSTILDQSSTTSSSRLFLSGERKLWKELTVRGGVQAGWNYSRNYGEGFDRYSETSYASRNEASSWSFGSPSIFLGAGWAWKSLVLNAQIRESINLDSPLVRWSATLGL